MKTEVVRAMIRVPWSLRLRAWWHRRTTRPQLLAMEDEIGEAMERALLFGGQHGPRAQASGACDEACPWCDEVYTFTEEEMREKHDLLRGKVPPVKTVKTATVLRCDDECWQSGHCTGACDESAEGE